LNFNWYINCKDNLKLKIYIKSIVTNMGTMLNVEIQNNKFDVRIIRSNGIIRGKNKTKNKIYIYIIFVCN
jgi:hypothetical protein